MPAESGLVAVSVGYQDGSAEFAGKRVHWMLAFVVLTMLFAVVLKKPMRVVM